MEQRLPGQSASSIARIHVWQIQAFRDVLVILAVIGLVWSGYAMRSVTVPLLVALALAYLFEPLVERLNRRGWSRPFIATAIICTAGVGVCAAAAVAVPLVVSQTVKMVKDVRQGRFYATALKLEPYIPQQYQDEFRAAAGFLKAKTIELPHEEEQGDPELESTDTGASEAVSATVPSVVVPATDSVAVEERLRSIVRDELKSIGVQAAPPSRSAMLLGFARGSAEWAIDLLGSIMRLGLVVFLVPFYFFFFCVSYPTVANFVRELVPQSSRARTFDLLSQMDRAVAGFVRGRLVICLVVGVVLAVGWMVVGVPYAIVLGILIGVFNAVPYLSGIGLPVAIGLLAFDQLGMPETQRMAWWGIFLWPTVVFGIAQVLDGYVLTPIIAGKATNLDPVTILVAVLAGGSVGGLYGMLLAIPAFACAKILIKEMLMPRIKAWTRGEAQDPLPIG